MDVLHTPRLVGGALVQARRHAQLERVGVASNALATHDESDGDLLLPETIPTDFAAVRRLALIFRLLHIVDVDVGPFVIPRVDLKKVEGDAPIEQTWRQALQPRAQMEGLLRRRARAKFAVPPEHVAKRTTRRHHAIRIERLTVLARPAGRARPRVTVGRRPPCLGFAAVGWGRRGAGWVGRRKRQRRRRWRCGRLAANVIML